MEQKVTLPEDQRDPAKLQLASEALGVLLAVLDGALADRVNLLGDSFTIADLNVASVLYLADVAGYDVSEFKHVQPWFRAAVTRPAFARVLQL